MIDLRQVFEESGLTVVFRTENEVVWNEIFERLPFRTVKYIGSALDYNLLYHEGFYSNLLEASCAIFINGQPIAIWPLTIFQQNGVWKLSAQGRPLMPPLFVDGCPDRLSKKCINTCLRIAHRIGARLGVFAWRSAVFLVGKADIGYWHRSGMSQGASCIINYELYVDLNLTLVQIKAKLRKSYRSLITGANYGWNVEVLRKSDNNAVWEEFRLFHLRVAERVTRSPESWQSQLKALVADEGFLVVVRDVDQRMVGAGYFMCTADEGRYEVGVYDRSMSNKPLGHVVQFAAIAELKRRGCSWYHLGTCCYPGQDPVPSQKELTITEFKQGFATHLFPSFVLTHKVEEALM